MLRITTDENPMVITFRLEERLEGPWMAVLANCWSSTRAVSGGRRLCVDLKGVTFIDAEGKAHLAAMHENGAEFIADALMSQAIVAEKVGQPPTKASQVLGREREMRVAMKIKRVGLGAARWGFRIALGAAAVAAAGCMVGPDYKAPPSKMPANYRELATPPTTAPALVPATSPAEVRWWRRFGDPQLTSLVEKAMAANYSVSVARARVREARASRQQAQALLYPQIDVGASVLRYRGPSSVISVPGLSLENGLYQVGFDARWTVDVFGGTRRGVESARASEQAAAADRRGIVLMVAAETARAYLELRGTQLELQIAQRTLEEQRQTLSVTEDRRRNGLSSDLEVLRARTEVESTAAEIPPLQESARQYIHVLSTLLGQEPTALAAELEEPALLPGVSGQVAVGIPSDLLRRRPDIQSAERDLAASTADVGVAAIPSGLIGLYASFYGGMASGAAIVLTGTSIFAIAFVARQVLTVSKRRRPSAAAPEE
jgi:NodT family efflux transporter outer membrane factor (OMF) lipoprotein